MDDRIVFGPDDVDLRRSPLRRGIDAPTHVLGAFNPGLTLLANGNLLLMVRIAEALCEPERDGRIRTMRWTQGGYRMDEHSAEGVERNDPRGFTLPGGSYPVKGLTSLSWLLPVEMDGHGDRVVAVHYDRAVAPTARHAEYGVEDARIVRIDGVWWMTACTVSSGRLATAMYRSDDGLNWRSLGLVLDHGNKDMVPFEGRVGERYMALTRPAADSWFVPPPGEDTAGGPSINFATSPDMLHWRPAGEGALRPLRHGGVDKLGGGTPPVRTRRGWLTLYHGVERRAQMGVYRTYRALLDPDDPTRILERDETLPVLEAAPHLLGSLADRSYLPHPVVFTCGMVDGGDHWIVASSEADLACRLTRIAKQRLD